MSFNSRHEQVKHYPVYREDEPPRNGYRQDPYSSRGDPFSSRGVGGVGSQAGRVKTSKSRPLKQEKGGRTESAPPRGGVGVGGRGGRSGSVSSSVSGDAPVTAEGRSHADIQADCLRQGKLFEDPDFPATDKTCFFSKKPPQSFVWKRPGEIVNDPQMFVGGASRFDVKQGQLGNCWLLAAVACLCGREELLHRVVPPEQSFSSPDYCGAFRFRFWRFGQWVEVVIDDRLPTYKGKLVFIHSADCNEFWTPLLEKAYAKLFSSYEALTGGNAAEAMEDFTGGLTEMYNFDEGVPDNLFSIMLKSFNRGSMMGCSIEADGQAVESELPNGLIMGHAYSITSVQEVASRKMGQLSMVRIRNPWGNECEWTGAWSDNSREWNCLSENEKRTMGLDFSDDGEFWMSYDDFVNNFQQLEICNLGPDSENPSHLKRWEGTEQHSGWVRRVSAGGCRNFIETFWTNPQFRVHVVDPDEDDDEDMGTLLVALMQKEKDKKRKTADTMMTIGYTIYKLNNPDSDPLDRKFFKKNKSIAKSPTFVNGREICGRHKLAPGHYCIVPSTFDPDEESDFLLRIYTETATVSQAIDEETGMKQIDMEKLKGDLEKEQIKEQRKGGDNSTNFMNGGTGLFSSSAQEGQMKRAFKQIAGEDMEVDAYELKDVLNNTLGREFRLKGGFSDDTCRALVAMKDVDRSGKLGYEEFKELMKDLELWKAVFKKHDQDNSGEFNSYELRKAFHSVGFKVSNATFNALVMRYARRDGKIYFDDYINCTTRLKSMFEHFKKNGYGKNEAKFEIDNFIQATMYS